MSSHSVSLFSSRSSSSSSSDDSSFAPSSSSESISFAATHAFAQGAASNSSSTAASLCLSSSRVSSLSPSSSSQSVSSTASSALPDGAVSPSEQQQETPVKYVHLPLAVSLKMFIALAKNSTELHLMQNNVSAAFSDLFLLMPRIPEDSPTEIACGEELLARTCSAWAANVLDGCELPLGASLDQLKTLHWLAKNFRNQQFKIPLPEFPLPGSSQAVTPPAIDSTLPPISGALSNSQSSSSSQDSNGPPPSKRRRLDADGESVPTGSPFPDPFMPPQDESDVGDKRKSLLNDDM
jgi:hypothetical protein